jgi:hypothetical protein
LLRSTWTSSCSFRTGDRRPVMCTGHIQALVTPSMAEPFL